MDTQTEKSSVQEMLLQLRAAFIDELPNKFYNFEQLVLQCDQSGHSQETLEELFRSVHSLKGAAGTHGLSMISTVCHHFEDQLKQQSSDYTAHCLNYIDLLRETAQLSVDVEDPDFSSVEEKLYEYRRKISANKHLALIVDSSRYNQMLLQSILENYPLEVIVVSDGIEALKRLLTEKFDLLVTSKEINTLNGVSILSALRTSDCVNRDIKCLMVSSTSQIHFLAGAEPEDVIIKDHQFDQSLGLAIEKLSLS